MAKINAIMLGIASIFTYSNTDLNSIINKYPATYEKDVEISIKNSWFSVGNALKGAIDKYDTEIKKTTN